MSEVLRECVVTVAGRTGIAHDLNLHDCDVEIISDAEDRLVLRLDHPSVPAFWAEVTVRRPKKAADPAPLPAPVKPVKSVESVVVFSGGNGLAWMYVDGVLHQTYYGGVPTDAEICALTGVDYKRIQIPAKAVFAHVYPGVYPYPIPKHLTEMRRLYADTAAIIRSEKIMQLEEELQRLRST